MGLGREREGGARACSFSSFLLFSYFVIRDESFISDVACWILVVLVSAGICSDSRRKLELCL